MYLASLTACIVGIYALVKGGLPGIVIKNRMIGAALFLTGFLMINVLNVLGSPDPAAVISGFLKDPLTPILKLWNSIYIYAGIAMIIFSTVECFKLAKSKGLNPALWAFLGLTFNIPALIFLQLKPDSAIPEEEDEIKTD
jgi:hypothetical protein